MEVDEPKPSSIFKQRNSEIPDSKHILFLSESTIRKLTRKIKNLKLSNCQIKVFLKKKYEAKALKVLELCFLPADKFINK